MIRINLSKKLGEERMSQAALARATNIRPTTISDLYNEMAARVGLEQLDKICEVLDCPLSDIMEYVPGNKKKPLE
nr:helix-turn-helix transcriptional regulator [uncultured Caproiciproducens sp.]